MRLEMSCGTPMATTASRGFAGEERGTARHSERVWRGARAYLPRSRCGIVNLIVIDSS